MIPLAEGTNPVYHYCNYLKTDCPKRLSETYIIEGFT